MIKKAFYEASLIIGATNKANILDIKQLKPGTIVIDDSIPHCFCSKTAYKRMNQKKDIICVEAGILTAPTDIAEERYVPKQLDKLKQFLPGIYTKREKNEITSCIFSSLITQKFKDIPHTIGMVDYLSAKKHYKICKEHKYTGTLLRLNGQNIPKVNIKRVKK